MTLQTSIRQTATGGIVAKGQRWRLKPSDGDYRYSYWSVSGSSKPLPDGHEAEVYALDGGNVWLKDDAGQVIYSEAWRLWLRWEPIEN